MDKKKLSETNIITKFIMPTLKPHNSTSPMPWSKVRLMGIIDPMETTKIVHRGEYTVQNYNSSGMHFIETPNVRWCTALSLYSEDLKLGVLAHFDVPSSALSFREIVTKLQGEVGSKQVVFKYSIGGGLECAHSPKTRELLEKEIQRSNENNKTFKIHKSKVIPFQENKSLTQVAILDLYHGDFNLISSSNWLERFFSHKFFCPVHTLLRFLCKIATFILCSKPVSSTIRWCLSCVWRSNLKYIK